MQIHLLESAEVVDYEALEDLISEELVSFFLSRILILINIIQFQQYWKVQNNNNITVTYM